MPRLYYCRARNLDDYRGILDAAMEKQGNPVHHGPARRHPHRTAGRPDNIRAGRGNQAGFSTDSLLSLMKTGLAGFSTHSAAKLENYVLMWRINGGRWRTEWTWNPDGLAEKTDETTKNGWHI